jgi:hypothetical protein
MNRSHFCAPHTSHAGCERDPTSGLSEGDGQRPTYVIGPLGERLTFDRLPPPDTSRWVLRRKAEVVLAIAGGLLSIEEACARYDLTLEELVEWQWAVDQSGPLGRRTYQFWRS